MIDTASFTSIDDSLKKWLFSQNSNFRSIIYVVFDNKIHIITVK